MVPEEIRAVKRPTNTVVMDQGTNSPKRYIVRARKTVKYIKGHNPQPVNGEVIGYIMDGKFVPKERKEKPVEVPVFLSWGAAAFIKSLSEDILSDLFKIMDITDACRTYVMAALRLIYPGIPNSKMRTSYQRSFLSKFFPGIPLSENTVTKHLANLGGNFEVRRAFFFERLKKVPSDHHVVIKKKFITNTDLVDDLLGLTYKPLNYESCGLYIVYAYDLEKSEPICVDIFPAKRFDMSLCKEFLTTNHINDRGFFFLDNYLNLKEVEEFRSTFADFPYLINLKRNDSRLITLNLLETYKFLQKRPSPILYSKTKIDDKTWIYVFKDVAKADLDESDYVMQAQRDGNFNSEEFNQRKETFGVLAFESNFDLSPELIYSVYIKREDLNPMFKKYMAVPGADKPRSEIEFEDFGSNFVNFISTIIASRMVMKEKEVGLLKRYSYEVILDDLKEIRRLTESKEPARVDDDGWVLVEPEEKALLVKLGLVEGQKAEEPKKRGRPRKNPPIEE